VEGLVPLLEKNDSGDRNFTYIETILAPLDGKESKIRDRVNQSTIGVKEAHLRRRIEALFKTDNADIALFYFAGHGHFDGRRGYLMPTDAEEGDYGVRMDDLIGYANESSAHQKIIILDCCHAGAISKEFASGASLGLEEGVIILVAASEDEYASESADAGGFYTSLIRSALEGGAANSVTGEVTVGGLYAYVDGAISRMQSEQSPLFIANLSTLTPLRTVKPQVPRKVIMQLTDFFPKAKSRLRLDPSFEPTADLPAKKKNAANEKTFASLQRLRAAGLVEPVGEKHMYYAAMNSKNCRLTALGRYYWMLVDQNKF
jgi:uncharacterized caspase-like protein